MNLVLANLDWNNWKEIWKDPSIQLQFSILIGLIVFVFALTKITKPLFISLSGDNENNTFKTICQKHNGNKCKNYNCAERSASKRKKVNKSIVKDHKEEPP